MRLCETKRADWSGLEETGRITGVSFSRESWIRSEQEVSGSNPDAPTNQFKELKPAYGCNENPL